MIKALWFALKVGLLVTLAVWIADQSGDVQIHWKDYAITLHLGFFLLLLLALVLASLFFYRIFRTILDFPKSLKRYKTIRAREKGYTALTTGLSAVAAGDTVTAKRHAALAQKYLSNTQGLSLLLQAQVARLEGREADAREKFTALLDHKDSAFLGIRGLLQTALDASDYETALALCSKALSLYPQQHWILKLTYDLSLKLHQWPEALTLLKRLEKQKILEPEKIISDRITLLLIQAEQDKKSGHPAQALSRVKCALKLDPAFAPTVLVLAEHYFRNGQNKKAKYAIENAWKHAPHPDLLSQWDTLLPDKKREDFLFRLSWIEQLLTHHKTNTYGLLAAGKAALEAGVYGVAKNYLEQAEALERNKTLYKLLIELEEKTAHREDRIKYYLEQMLLASPEKVWISRETGEIFGKWKPLESAQGPFNTIHWDYPDAFRHTIHVQPLHVIQ